MPVETDDGIPLLVDAEETPLGVELLPPDGGKLLKPGSFPAVLLLAVVFILLLPRPGKLEGLL